MTVDFSRPINWSRWRRMTRLSSYLTIYFFCLLAVVGCGSGNQGSAMLQSVNGSNIQRLANLYCVFQASNGFVGPKDETQFKEFITNLHPQRQKDFGINFSEIDKLFLSERDQQPFKIRWELKANSRQGLMPLVFEQQGVNGKLQIGCSSFQVIEVDPTELEKYWSGKMDGKISEADQRPVGD